MQLPTFKFFMIFSVSISTLPPKSSSSRLGHWLLLASQGDFHNTRTGKQNMDTCSDLKVIWGLMLLLCSESIPLRGACAHQGATTHPGKRLANSHTDRMKDPAWVSLTSSQHLNHWMLGEHTKFNNWTHLT